jgi:hypothetical protein
VLTHAVRPASSATPRAPATRTRRKQPPGLDVDQRDAAARQDGSGQAAAGRQRHGPRALAAEAGAAHPAQLAVEDGELGRGDRDDAPCGRGDPADRAAQRGRARDDPPAVEVDRRHDVAGGHVGAAPAGRHGDRARRPGQRDASDHLVGDDVHEQGLRRACGDHGHARIGARGCEQRDERAQGKGGRETEHERSFAAGRVTPRPTGGAARAGRCRRPPPRCR